MKAPKDRRIVQIEEALRNFPKIVQKKKVAAQKRQAIKKEFQKAAPLILKQIKRQGGRAR